MTAPFAAITGVGHSLPATERTNTDPVFAWLHAHPEAANAGLFTGLVNRYVLKDGERIETHMVIAAEAAMAEAGIRPDEVDGITGYLSRSEYVTPNALAWVHQQLGLPASAWVRPVDDLFTCFLTGLSLADAAVSLGRAQNVLVVCGGNWSRQVDYQTAQAITAADGAGAAVVGMTTDTSRFRLVDEATIMDTTEYGCMYLRPELVMPDGAPPYHEPTPVYTTPYFTISTAGGAAFKSFGATAPVNLVQNLLARNNIAAADITLTGYQVSTVLSSTWAQQIQPGQYIDTLAQLGNMTLATVPVNFARSYVDIAHDAVVMFVMNTSVGVGGLLLQRNR